MTKGAMHTQALLAAVQYPIMIASGWGTPSSIAHMVQKTARATLQDTASNTGNPTTDRNWLKPTFMRRISTCFADR